MAAENIDTVTTKSDVFISMAKRAKFIIILFAVAIVLEGVGIISSFSQVGLLEAMMNGLSVSDSVAEANDSRQALIGLVQVLLLIFTAVVFLRWFYRTHANLKPLQLQGLKYKSNWAVWYFFIPIINLVRPFQVAAEMWKASFSVYNKAETWQSLKIPACITVWWITHIVSGIMSRVASRIPMKSDVTIEDLIFSTNLDMAASAVAIVSIVFVIKMVKGITAAQEEKFKAIPLEVAGVDTEANLGGFTPEAIDEGKEG